MAFPSHRALERGASADLWRNTLSQIPSIYGRLVYLSSLRDPNSGRYIHHGMALVFGETSSDRTLRESHRLAFKEWLIYDLERQKADLDLYASSLEQDKPTMLEAWYRLRPYRNILPTRVPEAHRRLFLTDLETLLSLLRNEHGVSAEDPAP